MSEYDEDETAPEESGVDVTDVVKAWSWTPTRIAYVAGGIIGLSFVVWLIMDYNGQKAKFLREAVENATA